MGKYVSSPNYQIEQAEPKDIYTADLLELEKQLDYYSMLLTQSYLAGEENKEAHFILISILKAFWKELMPKIQNTHLEKRFSRWKYFYYDPRLFLIESFSHLIWEMEIDIRFALEHLNITQLV